MKGSIEQSGLDAASIGLSVLGNVVHTSPEDPYLSRKCSIEAGLPQTSTAFAVNRLCGSGLQAIIQTAMTIKCGDTKSWPCKRR